MWSTKMFSITRFLHGPRGTFRIFWNLSAQIKEMIFNQKKKKKKQLVNDFDLVDLNELRHRLCM